MSPPGRRLLTTALLLPAAPGATRPPSDGEWVRTISTGRVPEIDYVENCG